MGSFKMPARTESLRRVEEAHHVKNLVGEFEGLANRNKARPVYPDHYTQKKSPKTWGAPKVIKIEKTDRSEPEYLHQESYPVTPSYRRKNRQKRRRSENHSRRSSRSIKFNRLARKSLTHLSTALTQSGSQIFLHLKAHLHSNSQLRMYVFGLASVLFFQLILSFNLRSLFGNLCHFPTLGSIGLFSLCTYLLFD